MSADDVPVAVQHAYALWLWLDARLVQFPTPARALSARRICDAATDLLDALLVATYAPRGSVVRRDALVDANQHLALLRMLLRGARDRRYLAASQHDHAIDQLGELGRMIGGWLRAS